MTPTKRVLLVSVLFGVFAGCGDDGGNSIDASQSTEDSGPNGIDAPLNSIDAPPAIDATPLPPDSSTRGRACSFVETVTVADPGAIVLCIDPSTGANCRIIEQSVFSCFNDQVGFAFGLNAGLRLVAGVDSMTITGGTGGGALMLGLWSDIPNNTPGTVTGQSPTGQSYTVSFEYNGTVLTLSSISGP